ncbi:putative copper export protein [Motilibacter peucedani]|uniref:Putative copper export protein n=1 Tax=Motilibacter peucedani TaxID=598650 RepID=A0A420XRA0_9ACTN|nr:copper resistance CopC family protein [Motilibacter peucedani]RKS77384.1 putative copper export protein [Motilibacter peucedani]
MARLAGRLAAVVVVAAAALVGPVSSASAHAFLVESGPSDGQVVPTAPATLRMQFSESVALPATSIDIVDGDGRHYAPTHLELVRSSEDDEDPVQVVATLPALPHNTFRVSWETLSSDDLHRTSGVLVFGVDVPVRSSGLHETNPSPEESALRWALFTSVALALGGLLLRRLCVPAGLVAQGRRAAGLACLGGVGALAASVALLLDQLGGAGWRFQAVLVGAYGVRWLVREAGLLLVLTAALTAWRARRPVAGVGLLAAAGTVAAMVGSALLGHAGAARGPALTRVAAEAAHFGAAALWSGFLLAAVPLLLPLLRPGGDAGAARRVLRGFGVPAAACVSTVVVTGVYLASGVVGSVDAALFTTYGRVLLLKVVVAAVAGALGLQHVRRLHAAVPRPVRAWTLRAEAGAALLVLGLAGVLTSGQPAQEPQLVRAPHAATVPVVDGAIADLQSAVSVQPNRPGRNVVLVDTFDTRRPSPGAVRRVTLTVVGLDGRSSPPVAAERIAEGRWSAATTLSSPGRTQLLVSVTRTGLPEVHRTFSWTVAGAPSPTRAARVSTAPVDGLLRAAAAGLALAVLAGWLGFAVLRRRGRRLLPDAVPPARRADEDLAEEAELVRSSS